MLDFIGLIVAKRDPPGINKARWMAVMHEHTNLAPDQLFNAISREWEPDPRAEWAYVKVSKCVVGQMKWAVDANEIQVFGEAGAVHPIAREVAAVLDGRYDPDALMAHNPYSRILEPIWKSVSIYDGPKVFLSQFGSLRPEVGHLFAAHWCQSEVCNGGFHQFFSNPTGVLAPEALAGFRAIGLHDWAEILGAAMRVFGEPYPRDQQKREEILERYLLGEDGDGNPFTTLDDRFYEWTEPQQERFENAADEYARLIAPRASQISRGEP